MLILLLILLLLTGIDPPWWVWLLIIFGEPLFWLVTINLFSPRNDM